MANFQFPLVTHYEYYQLSLKVFIFLAQVSNAGPSWPSCFIFFYQYTYLDKWRVLYNIAVETFIVDYFILQFMHCYQMILYNLA